MKRIRFATAGIVLILLILTGSLICNFYLSREALRVYRELQRVNLDPSSSRISANRVSTTDPNGCTCRIVLFGDSRIAYWRPDFGITQCDVLNYGVPGETTGRALLRCNRDVVSLRPQCAIIQMGINDLKTIGVFPGREAAIVALCKANIDKIVNNISEAGIPIIITTIIPPGHVPWPRRWVWSERIDTAVAEVNAWIRTLQTSMVTVIDCDLVFPGDKEGLYRKDALHLNKDGRALLTAAVAPQVKAIISNNTD